MCPTDATDAGPSPDASPDMTSNAARTLRSLFGHAAPASIVMLLLLGISLALLSGSELRYPDEHEYDHLARSILAGDGFATPDGEPTAFRPPGWPVVLAGAYRFWPDPLAGKLLNAFALAGVGVLLSLLLGPLSRGAARIAPVLVMLFPVGLYTATTLYPQTWGSMLLCAVLVLVYRTKRTAATMLAAGGLMGLLCLTIPTFLLMIPVVGLTVALHNREDGRPLHRGLAVFSVVALLVISAWSVRNYVVFDHPVAISTNSGLNLLLGNSPGTGPNTGVNVDVSAYTSLRLSEVEQDQAYGNAAKDWIRTNPDDFLLLYVAKLINHFNYANQMATTSERSELRDLASMVGYYPVLLLAIVGLWVGRRQKRSATEISLYILYISFALVSALFFTRLRFRVPLDMVLLGIGALVIVRLRMLWSGVRPARDAVADVASAGEAAALRAPEPAEPILAPHRGSPARGRSAPQVGSPSLTSARHASKSAPNSPSAVR